MEWPCVKNMLPSRGRLPFKGCLLGSSCRELKQSTGAIDSSGHGLLQAFCPLANLAPEHEGEV